MSKYRLINPVIKGEFSVSFSGKSGIEAASNAWSSLSSYITNDVPKFAFTMEKESDGSLHHFLLKESSSGKGDANYEITELDLKLKPQDEKKFRKKISDSASDPKEMSGGKHKKHHHDSKDDDSSSSSSSSSSVYSALSLYKNRMRSLPISYWWYDPFVYNVESVFIPTFVVPINPYIEIATVSWYAY